MLFPTQLALLLALPLCECFGVPPQATVVDEVMFDNVSDLSAGSDASQRTQRSAGICALRPILRATWLETPIDLRIPDKVRRLLRRTDWQNAKTLGELQALVAIRVQAGMRRS